MHQSIFVQTRRLPAKQYNYFNGLRHFNQELPDNIICFRRTDSLRANFISRHHRFVLVANLSADGTAILNGQAISLPQNCGLLIFPHQTHSFKAPRRLNWLYITFELDRPDWLQPLHNAPVPLAKPCLAMLADLLQIYLRQREIPERGFRCALSLAWALHAMLAAAGQPASSRGAPDKAIHEMLVETINHYVYEHIDTRLTIPVIAGAVGLSPSHLRALFRKKLKTSLGVYVRNIRIDKAVNLLNGTDRLVKEIAFATGFASTASFIMTFKRMVGVTPSRYRQGLYAPATKPASPRANRWGSTPPLQPRSARPPPGSRHTPPPRRPKPA